MLWLTSDYHPSPREPRPSRHAADSMSEQMPISQPPEGMGDQLDKKPGSVGMPVAASCAIVSRTTLRPQPPGVEGEIAISGPTVLKKYLSNPTADSKAYFYITTPGTADPMTANNDATDGRFFLTGDVGVLDSEGFLSLKGRAKELIKKGGEQVSPYEVEEPLIKHPFVRTAICFSVPHKLYGEEVGAALILSPAAPADLELRTLVTELRALLKAEQLAAMKHPSKWIIVEESQIPKTPSKKYKRIGLSTVLGLDPVDEACPMKTTKNAKMDNSVLSGFRFYLACMVMFMHIGADSSWGAFSTLRQFPWHVHVFFTLGGYTMALPMAPPIKKKLGYFVARMMAMYPLYMLALVFAVANLLVSCRPDTFVSNFHWDSQVDDLYVFDGVNRTETLKPLFCEGTPAIRDSWAANFVLTVITHILGLQATPAWAFCWFLGFYLWFSSMYYQCLALFPSLYNWMYTQRGKSSALLAVMCGLVAFNTALLLGFWFGVKDANGYSHFDSTTGKIGIR